MPNDSCPLTVGGTREPTDQVSTCLEDMATVSEEQADRADIDNDGLATRNAAEEAKLCDFLGLHCMTQLDDCVFVIIGGPPLLAMTNLCGYGVQVVAYTYIARLGTYEIAPVILAQTTFNLAGFSVVIGLLGAMDTLCGQAWGAREYRTCGIVLQRGMLVTVVVSLPIIICWAYTEPILLLLGQSPDIVAQTVPYLMRISPVLLISSLAECITKWLTSQNVVHPSTFVNIGALMLAPLMFHIFTITLPWRLPGAATATIVSNLLDLVALAIWSTIYVQRMPQSSPKRAVWSGFSLEAFQQWANFLNLGIPSMAMLCLEWWAFEICTLAAGILPQPHISLTITGVCIQLVALAFMVPLGICQGVRIRVSNLLGTFHRSGLPVHCMDDSFVYYFICVIAWAGNATAAKGTIRVATSVCLAMIALWLAILVPSRALLTRLFLPQLPLHSDASRAMMDCILLIAVGVPADWLNCTLSGVLQGTGRQALGAQIYVVTYWCIGPVVLWLFAFHIGWGVRGIWATLGILTNLQVLVMGAAISTIDWSEEVLRARELIASQTGERPCDAPDRSDLHNNAAEPLLAGAGDSRQNGHLHAEALSTCEV